MAEDTASTATAANRPWPADGIESINACPLCGSRDREVLHTGLIDRLFGAPGQWTLHRCNGCGLGYLDPRPSRQTVGLAYAEYITHAPATKDAKPGLMGSLRDNVRNGYLARKYGFRLPRSQAWGYWAMHLLPSPIRWEQDQHARHLRAPATPGMRLLDVGCGNGEFLLNARSAGWQVDGLEPDPQAASIGASHGLRIHAGSYDSADYAAASFDVVTANQVIEHVHDPHDFVARIHRWLKPGGRVWIGTPNLDCPMHARFGRDYGNLHPPQHLLMFTPATLRRLFAEGGFSNVRFLKRGFHDYSQTLSSAALARGMNGPDVYLGVRNAPLIDRIHGLGHELAAWRRIENGSDLVMLAEKPHG